MLAFEVDSYDRCYYIRRTGSFIALVGCLFLAVGTIIYLIVKGVERSTS